VLCKEPGQPIAASSVQMSWVSADMLEAAIPLSGGQTMMASLDLGPAGHAMLPPVCLPYSSEYAPAPAGGGSPTLEALARITGGCQRADLATIWDDLPAKPRWTPLSPYLLLLAAILVLAEVLQRRTGMLTPARWLASAAYSGRAIGATMLRWLPRPKGDAARSDAPIQDATPGEAGRGTQEKTASSPEVKAKMTADKTPGPKPSPKPDNSQRGNDEFLDALSKAHKKAKDRTSR